MEKLIELLNEYNKEKTNGEIWWREREYDNEFWNLLYGSYSWWTFSTLYCISKKYWFIQRLVDNDKIDRDKVLISFSMAEYDGLWNMYWHWVDDNQRLLMILAISDTPIEDLVSTLK